MQKQTALESALSGAAGGFFLNGNIAGGSSFLSMAKEIAVKDGFFRGLYRGVQPVFIGTPVVLAVNLWAYNQAQRWVYVGMAGALASIPTSLLVAPAELVKVRLQVETTIKSSSTLSIVSHAIKTGQATRGLGCTFARDIFGSFFYFLVYESFKRQSGNSCSNTPNPLLVLFGGGVAGMVNWTIAMPFDNVKTRLQANPSETLRGIISSLHQQGWKSFFTGLRPTLIRAFPASMAFFGGVESSLWLMRLLKKNDQ